MFQNCITNTLKTPFTNTFTFFQDQNFYNNLSMRSDLLIFQPKNAVGEDLVITDEVNGSITFSQTDPGRRPSISDNLFQTGDDRFTPKGLVSSSGFTFKEIFVLCNFGGGPLFDNHCTLFSGTLSHGDLRIMGGAGSASFIAVSSINPAGEVRINQAPESIDVLPLDSLSVLHTCSDFTTPTDVSDINNWTIGFNSRITTTRGWSGGNPGEYSEIGSFIFSTKALTDTERLEITNAILQTHLLATV